MGEKKKTQELVVKASAVKKPAIVTIPKHPLNNDQSRNRVLLIESNLDSEQKRKGFGSSIKVELKNFWPMIFVNSEKKKQRKREIYQRPAKRNEVLVIALHMNI